MRQKIKDLLDGKILGKNATYFVGPASQDVSYKYCEDASKLTQYLSWANPGVDASIIRTMIDEEIATRHGEVIAEPVEIPNEKAIAEADGKVTESELLAMTRPALREYAAKMGIETGTFTKKADIIAAITAKP